MTQLLPGNVLDDASFERFHIYMLEKMSPTQTMHTVTFSSSSRVLLFLLDSSMVNVAIVACSCTSAGGITTQLLTSGATITMDTTTEWKLKITHASARPFVAIVFQYPNTDMLTVS